MEELRFKFTSDSSTHSESFVTANFFPWNRTTYGEKNPSALLEQVLRVGCCVVSRKAVVNVENHHLIIICLKL